MILSLCSLVDVQLTYNVHELMILKRLNLSLAAFYKNWYKNRSFFEN